VVPRPQSQKTKQNKIQKREQKGHGPSGGVPALQAQSPEFKLINYFQ
jgi:hypothetical protein